MSKSQAQTPTPNGSAIALHPPSTETQKVRLDVQKLHSLPSEQQDLYLFTFAVELESFVASLSHEELCTQQSSLNQEIYQIINLSSPLPSKAVRSNIGRAFGRILGQGNRRTLFETVNQLVAVINASKNEQELQNKHAAVYCLGEVYKAAGDSAINLSSLACSSLLRLLKPAQNHAGLRAAVFQALTKIIGTIEKAIDEGTARDIWKQARKTAADDRAALVEAKACACLEALARCTKYFDTTSHFEDVRLTVWKASETSVPATRHAAASFLATVLIKAYSEDAPMKSSAKAKRRKPAAHIQDEALDNGLGETPRPASPSSMRKVPEKLELSLVDILRHLSMKYTAPTTNNRTRATIVHCYNRVLTGLGSTLVEGALGRIIEHVLTDLLSNQFIVHDRYRLLLTRKYVQKILFHCIGLKILGEAGRLSTARALINDVLKNYPQVIQEIRAPSKHALVGALEALASLIESLGSAFRPLSDSSREALVQVLQHPSYTVQIHAANCLRGLVFTCPQQLLPCASICMNSVIRELGLLASETPGKIAPRRCVGYANGLAAAISISPSQPLYGSLEINSRVLTVAINLLKSSSQADLWVAGTQVQIAWILIGGLMSLGPNFVKIHLSQFLLLWRNALPKPLTKDNIRQRQSAEVHYLTSIRECTLGSILLFLEFNTKLVTSDVSKRIATMLQNTVEYLDSLPSRKSLDNTTHKTISSLSTQDLILMVKRRILQCYSILISISPHSSIEALSQSNLLNFAVSLLVDPDSYTSGSLSSSIANSSGTFDSLWDVADNSGFGVTGLVCQDFLKPLPKEQSVAPSIQSRADDPNIDDAVCIPAARFAPNNAHCLCPPLFFFFFFFFGEVRTADRRSSQARSVVPESMILFIYV